MTDEIFNSLVNESSEPLQTHADPIFQELSQPDQVLPKKLTGTAMDQVLQGATFGFADELGGLGGVLGGLVAGSDKSIPELYRQYRDGIREGNQSYAEANPWGSFGLQAVGAVPTGIAGGGRFLASKLAGQMPNALRNLTMGFTGGGVAGAGLSNDDSAGGVAIDAAQGAGVGAVAGVAIPPVMNKLSQGGSYLFNTAVDAFSKPSTRANRIVNQYLSDAGITNQQQLERAVSGVDNPILADASESTRMLTDAIAQQPGAGKDIIKPVLTQRKKEAGKNIVNALENATGKKAGYYESIDKIEETMKEAAGPLYKEAYETKIPFTSDLKAIFKRPVIKKAFQEMKEISEISGEELPELFRYNGKADEWIPTGKIPDAQGWDMIKRGLDSMIDTATDSDTGKVSKKGQEIIKLKNEMLKILDNANPSYGKARAIWSEGSGVKNAMEKGLKVLRSDDYLTSKQFGAMSQAEKEGFMLGAMNAIRDKIEMIPQHHNMTLKQLFTAPAMQRRLEKAFPSKGAYQEFMRVIKSEGRKAETNRIIENSMTATRQQHQSRLGKDLAGDAQQAARGDLLASIRMLDNILQNTKKLPDDAVTEIANKMVSPVSPNAPFFNNTQIPPYLQFLQQMQLGPAASTGGKGLLSYGSGHYSTK